MVVTGPFVDVGSNGRYPEVVEWLMAGACKASGPQGLKGSNPFLSAKGLHRNVGPFLVNEA